LTLSLLPVPASAGLGGPELAAARSQATNSLVTFQGFITPANFELLGFTNEAEILTATNADPLLIYTIPLSRLIAFPPTNDFTSLLQPDPQTNPAPVTRLIIPVMADANVRSAISLRLVPNEVRWTNASWGDPKLIRALVGAAQSIPPAQLAPGSVPFVVEIPVFDVWLIGYYNSSTPSKLVLVSTARMRFGPVSINQYEVITPTAMEQMRIAAQRYNGLPN
jgi:hypothetical protein